MHWAGGKKINSGGSSNHSDVDMYIKQCTKCYLLLWISPVICFFDCFLGNTGEILVNLKGTVLSQECSLCTLSPFADFNDFFRRYSIVHIVLISEKLTQKYWGWTVYKIIVLYDKYMFPRIIKKWNRWMTEQKVLQHFCSCNTQLTLNIEMSSFNIYIMCPASSFRQSTRSTHKTVYQYHYAFWQYCYSSFI